MGTIGGSSGTVDVVGTRRDPIPSRARVAKGLLTASVAAMMLAGLLPGTAAGVSTLTWSPPRTIDPHAPEGTVSGFSSVSCVSASLCVATDYQGNVLTSTDLTAPTPVWMLSNVDLNNWIYSVSCTSMTLCVAVDKDGNALISTDPGAPNPIWTVTDIDGTTLVAEVSCASERLCIALDGNGAMLITPDPGASVPTWRYLRPVPPDVDDISCLSESLCVGVGSEGVEFSTDPEAEQPSWTGTAVGSVGPYVGEVSCGAPSLCIAIDSLHNVFISTDAESPSPTWTPVSVGLSNPAEGVRCVGTSLCLAWEHVGNIATTTDPGASTPVWSVASELDDGSITDVSCASESLCVAVTLGGQVLIGKITHSLSVAVSGEGSVTGPEISCPGSCAAAYLAGSVVTLTALPAPGASFDGWSGACSGAGSCNVLLGADASVSATFSIRQGQPSGETSESGKGDGVVSAQAPAVIVKFSPLFKTRVALTGRALGLLVGFPRVSGLASNSTVVIRCRAACEYRLDIVRHPKRGATTIVLTRALLLRPTTLIEIAVTEPGHVGRFVDYAFRRSPGRVVPYAVTHGCLNTSGKHEACT